MYEKLILEKATPSMRPCQVAVFSVSGENIHLGDSFVMIGPITTWRLLSLQTKTDHFYFCSHIIAFTLFRQRFYSQIEAMTMLSCKDSELVTWWLGDMICIAESCCRCLNERETNISVMKRETLGLVSSKLSQMRRWQMRDKQAWQRTLTWILVTWWPYWAVVGTLATISVSWASNTGGLSLTSLMLTRTITSPSPDPPEPSPSMYRV